MSDLTTLLREAVSRRAQLSMDAVRLVDGAGDSLPRLVVERFGDAIRARGGPEQVELLPALREVFGEALFWRFGHSAEGGPALDEGLRVVEEGGLRFEVRLLGHRNTGLFLDGRSARAWVKANAAGRRVLNLFAYTCAFGVAAAAGGARATVNVDGVPTALARGERNYALSGQPFDARTFWREDVLEALKRVKRSGGAFDGIVLDPPPVAQGRSGRDRGRRLEPGRDLARLAKACCEVLAPGGWLLVMSSSGIAMDQVIESVSMGDPAWVGTSGEDFLASPKLCALAFSR